MEKFYITPISREIVAKGKSMPGYEDIFSYTPGRTSPENKLGSLYVIGHSQHTTDDVSYVVSLISALAKREYYARTHLSPKDAFTNTLKKINEVVGDLFRQEKITLDIGVVALIHDQILISKLGKFRILLARGDKTIDILNNVDLFEKEHVQEQEFSNIISGKVAPDDRLLAFYASRPMAARERYLKKDFLALSEDGFAKKIDKIHGDNENFSCQLLYISLRTVKELSIMPKIEPQELAEATLVVAEKKSAQIDKEEILDKKIPEAQAVVAPKPVAPTPAEQIPMIISSEFSLGLRKNFFSSALRRLQIINLNPKGRAALALIGLVLLIGTIFSVRNIFGLDPESRKLKPILSAADTDLRLAKTKLSQNDSLGARTVLLGMLNQLEPYRSDGETQDVQKELFTLLDAIDQARDAATTLLIQFPDTYGQVIQLTADAQTVFAYADKGQLFDFSSGRIVSNQAVDAIATAKMFFQDGSNLLLDLAGHTLTSVTGQKVTKKSVDLPANISDVVLYQGNGYFLTDSVIKLSDIASGKSKPTSWLGKKTTLEDDSALITIDGNVFVLTKDGTLTTYYKGSQSAQVKTVITPSTGSTLTTTSDSPYLYLLDPTLGRLYRLDKKTGLVTTTFKIKTDQPIVASALAPDETFYFVTSDNKLYKLQ